MWNKIFIGFSKLKIFEFSTFKTSDIKFDVTYVIYNKLYTLHINCIRLKSSMCKFPVFKQTLEFYINVKPVFFVFSSAKIKKNPLPPLRCSQKRNGYDVETATHRTVVEPMGFSNSYTNMVEWLYKEWIR